MAHKETKLNEQLKVAKQLLNPDPVRNPHQITHSQHKGAVEGPQELSEESEAKSSPESELLEGLRNLFGNPSIPDMMTPNPNASTDVKPKVSADEE
ncbi:hypothetical protein Moror_16737 [Moniliophthora roreri MCA 2997]|nr:hypothetical protein Moror_16737 [Moniliophthora roreri MCA 2997]